MGMYDTFNGIQLKVGDCVLDNFKIGDKVSIPDGVYLAPDGVVVVLRGVLVFTSPVIHSKWGGPLSPDKLLEPINPFVQVAKDMKARRQFITQLSRLFPNQSIAVYELAVDAFFETLYEAVKET